MSEYTTWHQRRMTESGFHQTATSLSSLSDAALRAELSRRSTARGVRDEKPECGSSEPGVYNTPIHVMALFLILALSTLGNHRSPHYVHGSCLTHLPQACSFPVLARRFPRLPIPRRFLFLSRHFGTGVLIATAFVHLLPTAFVSLTDPCLPRFWSESYRAMAGFIAMISVFVVVVVEMFFAMKGAGHVHGSEYDQLISDVGLEISHDGQTPDPNYSMLEGQDSVANHIPLDRIPGSEPMPSTARPPISTSRHPSSEEGQTSSKNTMEPKEDDDLDLDDSNSHDVSWISGQRDCHPRGRPSHESGFHPQADANRHLQNPQRQLLQCLLLEAGILFHSIFIGMALSVATGTSFLVLLVAICFHQTFEGFALGSRIASLIPDLFSPSSMKPWLMSLAYGMTTPIGQAIGLMLHNLYDPASTAGLLMVGITNAISSGLLLFAGLVELLAEDFLSDASYATLRGRRRIEACVAVASGAVLMALVGAFA
ncbi:putative ZIP family zinc transporter [Aspergillus steynii IBT 23096]|uniref:Putative ZIP family zinc transporter n=1 Tax=Aspergillus steynii IBT 23096 TaxID=1392250 RepID=A0A2I2FVN5_9EURO|nr:putative ZIP family zinc transporter [Aspergillus steynii IBT 23096]PLB44691.1 putative ZIP family zinc transporter [Aspergillus steynii IBT 23096]